MPFFPSPSSIINKLLDPVTEAEFATLAEKHCAICREPANRPVRLTCQCGIIFCDICARTALATGNDSCPFCRTIEPPVVSLRRFTRLILDTFLRQTARIAAEELDEPVTCKWIMPLVHGVLRTWDTVILTILAIAFAYLERTMRHDLILLARLLVFINAQLFVRAACHLMLTAAMLGKEAMQHALQRGHRTPCLAYFACLVLILASSWYSARTAYLAVGASLAPARSSGISYVRTALHGHPPPSTLDTLRGMVESLILQTGISHVTIRLYGYLLSRTELYFEKRGKAE